MKLSSSEVNRIRDISIADQMGVTIRGRRATIQCPMPDHRDSTPSFIIDEDNAYHCFGCGAHGHGFIDFCVEFLSREGMDQKEAFKKVIEEYGNTNNREDCTEDDPN